MRILPRYIAVTTSDNRRTYILTMASNYTLGPHKTKAVSAHEYSLMLCYAAYRQLDSCGLGVG